MRPIAIILFLCFIPTLLPAADTPLVVQPALKEIVLTGYTRSDTTLTVSAEVSGKVLRVNYDVGETVGEAPFFEIDPTFIDFQIESVRQSIEKIEAARKKNRSQVAYLKKEFDRFDRLHKGERATEVRRDAALEEYTQAKLEAGTLAAEKQGLMITLEELLERKRRHRIHAPEGWVVVARQAEPGEIIAPNVPLARVADFRNLAIPLAVSGEELAAIQAMDPVFDARLDGAPVKARIAWINPEFNEETRKLSIELMLVDYGGEHRGGLRFSLPLQVAAEGLWVPRRAVISRYDNPRVRLESTGETVNVMVLGESDDHLIIAPGTDDRLTVGTELALP
jgi:multidrug efflux pump subunit AcrA (membrane-fusion protein)